MKPYFERTGKGLTITEAGYEVLSKYVTDAKGSVYAFKGELSPVTAAAAMARLSRRAGDMRLTLLEEFIGQEGKDDQLLHRVITAFGDDSVQQLSGIQFVVEGASNLLTKLLEWGRLASYLEQSTRYIYYDTLGPDGRYNFYTPQNLAPKLRDKYESEMTRVFKIYSEVVRELTDYVREQTPLRLDSKSTLSEKSQRIAWQGATRAEACDAARTMLPAATRSTVGIFASAQAFDSLVMHLLSEPLQEAVDVGRQLLVAGRQVIPAFLERTDMPERGGAVIAYRAQTRSRVRKLAFELLADTAAPNVDHPTVALVRAWPAEDEILAEMLFESSSLPLASIKDRVATLTANQKINIITTYVGDRLNRRHKPGRALEIIHLEWEIVGDYGGFRDLQRHRIVDAFEWQSLSPDLGYSVPPLIAKCGLEAKLHECFAISSNLYESLNGAGHELEAQYAVLMGNRVRYRFVTNMRAFYHFVELRSQPAGHAAYRWVAQQMYEQATHQFPNITAGMTRFVNQDENPELTRLAAEMATQFKLDKLDKKK